MQIEREILFNMGGPHGITRWLLYIPFIIAMVFFIFGIFKRIQLYQAGQQLNRKDEPGKRVYQVILDAIFQRKILREAINGLMHAWIFWGFAILFIVTLLILLQEDIAIPIAGEGAKFIKVKIGDCP